MDPDLKALGLVALAAVLGGALGLDRELRGKPAGLRTHMLVAASTAMFVMLGEGLDEHFVDTFPQDILRSDPMRVMQSMVLALGFLGSGTIVVHGHGERVEGLTTASSLLVTAAIGVAVAIERIGFAVGSMVLAVVILAGFGALEHRIARWRKDRQPSL